MEHFAAQMREHDEQLLARLQDMMNLTGRVQIPDTVDPTAPADRTIKDG